MAKSINFSLFIEIISAILHCQLHKGKLSKTINKSKQQTAVLGNYRDRKLLNNEQIHNFGSIVQTILDKNSIILSEQIQKYNTKLGLKHNSNDRSVK